MPSTINSNMDIANNYAGNIAGSVSSTSVASLAGVDDDNTLAESGVYNSFNSLRETFETLKGALMADADNLRAAASCFENADSQEAGNFK